MKSIDEAGVEWHLSHPDADKEETWKAGANYVLEEIEKIIKYDKDPHCIEFLKERIWRLKKEK